MAFNSSTSSYAISQSASTPSIPQSSYNNTHHPHATPPESPEMELRSHHSPESLDHPRTVSREGSTHLRHPTPDLQSLQGAYVGNVERLEESAERLSLSSDIGEEIRKMKLEQKLSESRRSSLYKPQDGSEPFHSPSLSRQFSYSYGTHASNSIVGTNNIARSGGFSPAGYFASPRSSIRSGSWSQHNSVKERRGSSGRRLTQVTEPEQEGKPLDSPISTRLANLVPAPLSPTRALRVTNDNEFNLNDIEIPQTEPLEPEHMPIPQSELVEDDVEPRASTDTYRQTQTVGLFSDFDGVHTVQEALCEEPTVNPRRSSQLLGTERPMSYMQPTPGEDMVYYPAPVPMMLNLPKRLSKLPAAPQREKRRSEMLSNLPADARKSAIWLPDTLESVEEPLHQEDDRSKSVSGYKRKTMADLPPQLRASMFFDYPASQQDVEVKGASAVATLDSILDASAFAPVSAFTDHPIAGHGGSDVYAQAATNRRASQGPMNALDVQKRRSTMAQLTKNSNSNLLDDTKKRNSSLMSLGNYFSRRKSTALHLEDTEECREIDATHANDEHTPLRQADEAYLDISNETHDPEQMELEPGEHEEQPEDVSGEPTTLLAELQLRKQQQKQRNRTAATAFPDGMHSTLLQLDAVAQVQKQARKQKHTKLAWENPNIDYPGPENADDEDVPLGMLFPGRKMESRRLTEDRPLGLIAQRAIEDNEPLSQRRARLRGEDPSLRHQSLFHQQSMRQVSSSNLLDTRDEDDGEDPNETLAQRIKRIKATQIPTQPRPVSGDFASEIMSQFGVPEEHPKTTTDSPRAATKTPDLDETLGERRKRLQAEAERSRNVSGESNIGAPQPVAQNRRSMADILQAHPAASAGARTASNELKFTPAPKTRNTPWAMNMNRQASLGQVPMATGHASGIGRGFAAPHPMMQMASKPGEVDARQRDMVDRWRQSVMF